MSSIYSNIVSRARCITGYSLVELMMTLLLGSIIALGIASVTQNAIQGIRTVEQNISADIVTDNLNTILANSNVCAKNFGATSATPRQLIGEDIVQNIVDAYGANVFEVGPTSSHYNNQLRVTSLTLTQKSVIFNLAPAKVLASLNIKFERLGNSNAIKNINRSLTLEVELSGAIGTTVASCKSVGKQDIDKYWQLATDGETLNQANSQKIALGSITHSSALFAASSTQATAILPNPSDNPLVVNTNLSHVVGANQSPSQWKFTVFSNNPQDSTFLHLRRARGSMSSPSTLEANDIIGSFQSRGYHEGDYINIGGFEFVAAEDWSATSTATKFRIWGGVTNNVGRQLLAVLSDRGLSVGLGYDEARFKYEARNALFISTEHNTDATTNRFLALGRSDANNWTYIANSNHDFQIMSGLGQILPGGQYPDIDNANTLFTISDTGRVGVLTSSPNYALDINGDIHITGTPWRDAGDISWQVPSDERLKEKFTPFEPSVAELLQIPVYRYHYKVGNIKKISPDKEFIGVIAQDAAKVIPEAVNPDKDGYLSLNPSPIFWAMINATKDLSWQIKSLFSALNEVLLDLTLYASRLRTLEEKILEIENRNLDFERTNKQLSHKIELLKMKFRNQSLQKK